MAIEKQQPGPDIDGLYALPLDEFTATRDELARRLRGNGDGEAAEEVRRLRKPSVAAWALNQVRRTSPGQTDELIDVGERLREAQGRLLAGEGREDFQQAAADERQLVAELARHAERELVAAGRTVSASVGERLRATLHAVASDTEARADFAAGRLVRDHEATGLGPLGAAPPRAARADRTRGRKARQLEERLERARTRRLGLEDKSTDAAERLREARTQAARAAAELERAEAADEQARHRAAEAAAAVAELEQQLGRR